jgi:hypothetical protein
LNIGLDRNSNVNSGFRDNRKVNQNLKLQLCLSAQPICCTSDTLFPITIYIIYADSFGSLFLYCNIIFITSNKF